MPVDQTTLTDHHTTHHDLLTQLQNHITGAVITPEDASYDALRTVFYGGIDRHPAVIVRAAHAPAANGHG
ncbi:MAG: hypothetical protein OHK0046_48650 [Anaerolineae bacterium]